MTLKPVVPRELANRDVAGAIAYYVHEASMEVAFEFIDALEHAYAHLSRYPASGSTRYAHELDLPGLRAWPLKRFPYILFYAERDSCVDVWRVLHSGRDIPKWMQHPPDSGTT